MSRIINILKPTYSNPHTQTHILKPTYSNLIIWRPPYRIFTLFCAAAFPEGIALDASGRMLYIVDSGRDIIFRVSTRPNLTQHEDVLIDTRLEQPRAIVLDLSRRQVISQYPGIPHNNCQHMKEDIRAILLAQRENTIIIRPLVTIGGATCFQRF